MTLSQNVSGIIDDLYAGALDDGAWDRAIVHVADLAGASGAQLFAIDLLNSAVLRDETHRLDPAIGAKYRAHYFTKDILVEPFLRYAVGRLATESQMVTSDQWRRSEIFGELAAPHDTPYVLGALLYKSRAKFVALSLKTSFRHGPFTPLEVDNLSTVIPHLRRALEVKDRLALSNVRADNLAQSLDNLSFGVLILDASGRVIESSSAAQEIMCSPDSGVHVNTEQRICLREPANTELYRWLVAGAPPPRNFDGLLHVQRPSKQPISVLVSPLPQKTQSWIGGDPRWMLLLFDPERRTQVSIALIARDLGISAREAEIAALLTVGYDLNNIALRLNISANTVRTHLKTIFSKTGIHTQSELIRRIAVGPSAISRGVQ
jgi:DNA-binding CsgD family transcriptional regulator